MCCFSNDIASNLMDSQYANHSAWDNKFVKIGSSKLRQFSEKL